MASTTTAADWFLSRAVKEFLMLESCKTIRTQAWGPVQVRDLGICGVNVECPKASRCPSLVPKSKQLSQVLTLKPEAL